VHTDQDFGTTDKDGSFAKFFFTVIQRSLLYQLLDLCKEFFGEFCNNPKSPCSCRAISMICNNPQNLQVHMSMKDDFADGNSSQQILHIHTNT
jgi:hypothetical protein